MSRCLDVVLFNFPEGKGSPCPVCLLSVPHSLRKGTPSAPALPICRSLEEGSAFANNGESWLIGSEQGQKGLVMGLVSSPICYVLAVFFLASSGEISSSDPVYGR